MDCGRRATLGIEKDGNSVSRGHGVIQREILARLDLSDPWVWTTFAELAGDGASHSRIESMRRAVARLRTEGLIETSAQGVRLAQPGSRARDAAAGDSQLDHLRLKLFHSLGQSNT
jgi:hypothetical protein